MLFDHWYREEGGEEVYTCRDSSPDARENHPRLRQWKRARFLDWLAKQSAARRAQIIAAYAGETSPLET